MRGTVKRFKNNCQIFYLKMHSLYEIQNIPIEDMFLLNFIENVDIQLLYRSKEFQKSFWKRFNHYNSISEIHKY